MYLTLFSYKGKGQTVGCKAFRIVEKGAGSWQADRYQHFADTTAVVASYSVQINIA
jgi:hypothetical protein